MDKSQKREAKEMERKRLIFYQMMMLFLTGGMMLYTALYQDQWQLYDYAMLSLFSVISILGYFKGTVLAIGMNVLILVIYGLALILQSYWLGDISLQLNYSWIIAMPLGALLTGNIGEILAKTQKRLELYEINCEKMNLVDFATGFGNSKSFFEDFAAELAESKRYQYPVTIGMIEILYFDELTEIYKGDVSSVVKRLAETLDQMMRVEDSKYRLDEKTFGIMLPHTDLQGALILRKRIKEGLLDGVALQAENNAHIKFEIKMALKVMEEESNDPQKFMKALAKDLEYDV